jgi:uncharacterized membrane protein YhaH (DUF805 family)
VPINFSAIFLPASRADADTFWLGLGIIAFLDALRLTLFDASLAMMGWLVILFFTAALHINRLRDAGRQGPLVIIPLAAGVAMKMVTALIAVTVAMLPMFMRYLEASGVDINDPAAVQEAGRDPAIVEGFQQHWLENEADAMAAFAAGDWPSAIAFWAVVFVIGFWFARMPRRAG